jgi:hypothetical protein
MKIIITEEQNSKLINDFGLLRGIKMMGGYENFNKIYPDYFNTKQHKIDIINDLVGSDEKGWNTFCRVFNIEGPMDFLHLFDDLDVALSYHKDYILYRYEPGNNIMVYDKFLKCLYINQYQIWDFLNDELGIEYYSIQELTKKWAEDVYNLNLKRTEPLLGPKYIQMV